MAPELRAELCDRLAAAGVPRIEAVSFVHPKWVPAMAGAEEVMAAIKRRRGTVYAGLVLNQRGYDRALAAGVDEIHYGFPVTEQFARRNQNSTVADGLKLSHLLVERARADGLPITVTLIVSFGCPFEGRVRPKQVLDLVEKIQAVPPDEVAVADTIGVGVPSQVRELVDGMGSLGVKVRGCHFHNTRNTGYANAIAAIESGVTVLDASVGGAGGCPFAPRATGNIATEDLVNMLEGMGMRTGIDVEATIGISLWLGQQLGKELPGMVARAGTFAPAAG